MSIVISAEHVSKRYRLGQINTGTLLRDLQSWMARKRGRPDPNLTIAGPLVGKNYGDTVWALNDVTFSARQGEAIGIIGRNGAGKSTLLKILSRVTAPTKGLVKIRGRIASLLEVGTGFHPELTGRENVYLNGAILGMTRAETRRKFDEIVGFSGVEQFIDTPVKRYSSGMCVRLAFAVAAHLEPEILVVDEVLAVGDAEFQQKCLGKMGEAADKGRTVLFVSHNTGALAAFCKRGILISKGEIVFQGEIGSAISKYLNENKSKGEYIRPVAVPTNKKLHITGARLLKNGNVTELAFNSETLTLRIECLVIEPIRDAQIAFELLDELGQCVFTSTSLDQSQSVDFFERGEYVFQCSINLKLLRPGRYFVSVASSIPCVEMLDSLEVPLVFDLADDCSPTLKLGQNRRGVVFVELPWTISREN